METVSIDELKPGVETDRLVADAIGNTYSCDDDPPGAIDFLICVEGEVILHKIQPDGSYLAEEFLPSRDLNAAFWAAERVELFWPYLLTKDCNGKDPFIIYKWDDVRSDNLFFVSDGTPAMAICKAILKLKDQP